MRQKDQKLRKTDSNKNYTCVYFISTSDKAARASVPLVLLKQTTPSEAPHLHRKMMHPIRTDDPRFPGEYMYEIHTAVNSQSEGFQVYMYFKDLRDIRNAEAPQTAKPPTASGWFVEWSADLSVPPILTKTPFMKVNFHDRDIRTPLPLDVQDAFRLVPNVAAIVTPARIDMLRKMANKQVFANMTPINIAHAIIRNVDLEARIIRMIQ